MLLTVRLLALFASAALLLAIAPPLPALTLGAERDTIGLAVETDALTEAVSSPSLDDDVVHAPPIVGAPSRVVRVAREVRSDERRGVEHTSEPRPPRAC